MFRIFRICSVHVQNVQNLFRIFSNVQTLFRIFSNVQTLFRIFSNAQTLFRISSTKTGLFRISWLCSDRLFGFIAPKSLNYLAFQSFDFERTWWLFQKRAVCIKLDIYVIYNCRLKMNGIPRLTFAWFYVLFRIRGLFVSLIGQRVKLKGTWWRLFQKCVVYNKLDIYVFIIKADLTVVFF